MNRFAFEKCIICGEEYYIDLEKISGAAIVPYGCCGKHKPSECKEAIEKKLNEDRIKIN